MASQYGDQKFTRNVKFHITLKTQSTYILTKSQNSNKQKVVSNKIIVLILNERKPSKSKVKQMRIIFIFIYLNNDCFFNVMQLFFFLLITIMFLMLFTSSNFVSCINWSEYKKFSSPLKYLQYKRDLHSHHSRVKREQYDGDTLADIHTRKREHESIREFDSIQEKPDENVPVKREYNTDSPETAVAKLRNTIEKALEDIKKLQCSIIDNCKKHSLESNNRSSTVSEKPTETTAVTNVTTRKSILDQTTTGKANISEKLTSLEKVTSTEKVTTTEKVTSTDKVTEKLNTTEKVNLEKSSEKVSLENYEVKHKEHKIMKTDDDDKMNSHVLTGYPYHEDAVEEYEYVTKLAPYKQLLDVKDSGNYNDQKQLVSEVTTRTIREEKIRRWDKWTPWSSCSVTCGKGRQIRWRHCILQDCSEAELEMDQKDCQLPACGSKFLGIFNLGH